MILVISGLPKQFTYKDVKSIIKDEVRIHDFILDNLVLENGQKKITVGLADNSEASLLVGRLDGFAVMGHRLAVAPLGSSQPGHPSSSAGQSYGYGPPSQAPQAPSYGSYQTYPLVEPSPSVPSRWVQGTAPQSYSQAPETIPRVREHVPYQTAERDRGRHESPPRKRGRSPPGRRGGLGYSPPRKSPRPEYHRSPPRKITPWEKDISNIRWGESGPSQSEPPAGQFDRSRRPDDRSAPRYNAPWRDNAPAKDFVASRSPPRDERASAYYEKPESRRIIDADPYFENRGCRQPAGLTGSSYPTSELSPISSGPAFHRAAPVRNEPPTRQNPSLHPGVIPPEILPTGSKRDLVHRHEPRGPPEEYGRRISQWESHPKTNPAKPSYEPTIQARHIGPDHGQHFGPGGRPQQSGFRDGQHFEPRNASHLFGARDDPQQFHQPRDGPNYSRDGPNYSRDGPNFGPLDVVQQEFGVRNERFDRGGPPEFGREAHNFEPRRDFVPRDRSQYAPDIEPHGHTIPRNEARPDQWGRHAEPEDRRPNIGREFTAPKHDLNYPSLVTGPREEISKDYRPREQFERERIPNKFKHQSPEPYKARVRVDSPPDHNREFRLEKNGRAAPDDRFPLDQMAIECEREMARSPRPPRLDRSRSRNRNSRPAELPKPPVRPHDSSEQEMELRDIVVGRISNRLLVKYKPKIPEKSQLYNDVEHELRKVVLDRIDSIFGIEFGHTFDQISDGYKLHHKESSDLDLLDKLVAKCTAQNYVTKKPNSGFSGPPSKKTREIDSRPYPKGHNSDLQPFYKGTKKSTTFQSPTGIPNFPYGGGDDLKESQSRISKDSAENINNNILKHKLYIIKDDFAPVTAQESANIKEFLFEEIIDAADKSEFTPSFKFNSVQNAIGLEVIAENDKSRAWLLNHNMSGFKPFNILAYTLEELTYERACIWLPGHTNMPLKPLEKLKLQNKHMTDVNMDKWKIIKCTTMETGMRIFLDIDKESSLKLANYNMTLNYDLEKVFVILKCMSTDRGEFDKVYNEPSVPIDSYHVYIPDIPNLPMQLNKNTVFLCFENETMSQETAKKLKHLIISKMLEDLMSDDVEIKFSSHGLAHESKILVFVPENEKSSEWLQSLKLEVDQKKVVIEKGIYCPKYLRVGAHLLGELGKYGPSVLQNFETENKIKGVDFTKWRLTAQMVNKEETASKVALEADFQSMVALRPVKFCLKYNSKPVVLSHNHHSLLQSYVQQTLEVVDHYDNEDMDIDQEDSEHEGPGNENANQIKCVPAIKGNEEQNHKICSEKSDDSSHTGHKNDFLPTSGDMTNTNEECQSNCKNLAETMEVCVPNINVTEAVEIKSNCDEPDNNEKNLITPAGDDGNSNDDDDDVIFLENKEDIVTIDSEEEDEYSVIKKDLEGMFRSISKEIEKRQKKDPLGRDVFLRCKYEKSVNVHEWRFEGKFTEMSDADLEHYHHRLMNCKIPSKEEFRRNRALLNKAIDLVEAIDDKIDR